MIEGERFCHVEQGSGSGFVASDEISDSVFLAVMERAYILKERRIKAFRHRDDMFIIAEGSCRVSG